MSFFSLFHEIDQTINLLLYYLIVHVAQHAFRRHQQQNTALRRQMEGRTSSAFVHQSPSDPLEDYTRPHGQDEQQLAELESAWQKRRNELYKSRMEARHKEENHLAHLLKTRLQTNDVE
jgi:hypothetical protein